MMVRNLMSPGFSGVKSTSSKAIPTSRASGKNLPWFLLPDCDEVSRVCLFKGGFTRFGEAQCTLTVHVSRDRWTEVEIMCVKS